MSGSAWLQLAGIASAIGFGALLVNLYGYGALGIWLAFTGLAQLLEAGSKKLKEGEFES